MDYTKKIEARFRKCAWIYDSTFLPISKVRKLTANFYGDGEGKKAIDICTGTGEQAILLAKKGYEVIGLDLSADMMKIAQKKAPTIKFIKTNVEELPIKDNFCDLLNISFGLHEMPSLARENVLKEIARVTKPDGTVVITDYSLPKNRIIRFVGNLFLKIYECEYYKGFSKEGLEKIVKKANLKIIEEKKFMFGFIKILKCKNAKHHL